eukprot:1347570-Pyramimonas_sp.AAC.1
MGSSSRLRERARAPLLGSRAWPHRTSVGWRCCQAAGGVGCQKCPAARGFQGGSIPGQRRRQ